MTKKQENAGAELFEQLAESTLRKIKLEMQLKGAKTIADKETGEVKGYQASMEDLLTGELFKMWIKPDEKKLQSQLASVGVRGECVAVCALGSWEGKAKLTLLEVEGM